MGGGSTTRSPLHRRPTPIDRTRHSHGRRRTFADGFREDLPPSVGLVPEVRRSDALIDTFRVHSANGGTLTVDHSADATLQVGDTYQEFSSSIPSASPGANVTTDDILEARPGSPAGC
jgi:hypothetical protein